MCLEVWIEDKEVAVSSRAGLVKEKLAYATVA
jgi:hypothetical protein